MHSGLLAEVSHRVEAILEAFGSRPLFVRGQLETSFFEADLTKALAGALHLGFQGGGGLVHLFQQRGEPFDLLLCLADVGVEPLKLTQGDSCVLGHCPRFRYRVMGPRPSETASVR